MHNLKRFAFGLAVTALLALPAASQAQTATISGALGNFDVINYTGHDAHGFEIELEGLQPNDVYYTFNANRYGAPKILPSALGTIVRWENLATATIPKTPGTPFAGTCYQWGGAAYATSGCEHFGMSLRANASRAITRWLIDSPDAPGTLVAYNPPTPVAIPSYIVIAPVVAGNPPVVQAEVQAPEPPETPERFGDAQWVKIFVQQLPQEVTLEQLTADNPTIVPLDPAQTEVSWDVLQQDPPSNSNGNQRRNRRQVQGSLKADTRTVVRRSEEHTSELQSH